MKINSIKLRNWKSYDQDGIVIDGFKKINIIIGPNNSGKSNIFKYLYHLREIVKKTISKTKNINLDYGILNNIDEKFAIEYTWAWKNEDIRCEIDFDKEAVSSNISISEYLKSSHKIIGVAKHFQEQGKLILSILNEENKPLLEEGGGEKPRVYDSQNYVDMKESIVQSFDTYNIWKEFNESLIFIDPIRHIDRNSTLNDEECDFNGCNLKEEILNLNKDRAEWVSFRKQLEKWLKEILNEEKFELSVTGERKLIFLISKGTQEIEAYFKDLGTGVSQLFMILSYLLINKSRKLNVFIEEPECNLHPEAVIKLVHILESEFENHTFYITTHSSMLIDQLNRNWSISRMLKKSDQASFIHPCNTIIDKYEILDELGIRASQILQSNYIIWIEGPSDRIYINKWIELFSNNLLKEDVHYTYLMYGGTNLASYSLLETEGYINLLATSRYTTIVCDSDKDNETDQLKTRVKNLIDKTDTLTNIQVGYYSDISKYVDFWITDGREIENYIKEELFLDILFQEGFKKSYFKKKDEPQKKLIFDKRLKDDFDKFHSFDKYFAARYTFENGESLCPDQLDNISNHYSGKKVEISKQVASRLNNSNYANLDLEMRMQKIVGKIRIANNLKV